jgi:predicted enzyme involved in methoxymalonyl-ACP biosynthesis
VSEYIPTKKNGQVANFYTDRGFETVSEGQVSLDLEQGGLDDSAHAMFKVIANA